MDFLQGYGIIIGGGLLIGLIGIIIIIARGVKKREAEQQDLGEKGELEEKKRREVIGKKRIEKYWAERLEEKSKIPGYFEALEIQYRLTALRMKYNDGEGSKKFFTGIGGNLEGYQPSFMDLWGLNVGSVLGDLRESAEKVS